MTIIDNLKRACSWIKKLFSRQKTSSTLWSVADAESQRETEGWMAEIMSQANYVLSPERAAKLRDDYFRFLIQTRNLIRPQNNDSLLITNMRFRKNVVSSLSDHFNRLRLSQTEEAVEGDSIIPNGQRVMVKSINCRGTVKGWDAGFDDRPQYIITLDKKDKKERGINDVYAFAYARGLRLIEGENK